MKGNVLTTLFGLIAAAGQGIANASDGTIHNIAGVASVIGIALLGLFTHDAGNNNQR